MFYIMDTDVREEFNFCVHKEKDKDSKFCYRYICCANLSRLDFLGNWQRKCMLDVTYDKTLSLNTHQREGTMMHDVFKIANVPLPKDKTCDYPRSVDMNWAEMHVVNISSISLLSKQHKR